MENRELLEQRFTRDSSVEKDQKDLWFWEKLGEYHLNY